MEEQTNNTTTTTNEPVEMENSQIRELQAQVQELKRIVNAFPPLVVTTQPPQPPHPLSYSKVATHGTPKMLHHPTPPPPPQQQLILESLKDAIYNLLASRPNIYMDMAAICRSLYNKDDGLLLRDNTKIARETNAQAVRAALRDLTNDRLINIDDRYKPWRWGYEEY